MSIFLVEGTPGSGKTAYCARRIAAALAAGQPVATNVELRPDVARFVARRTSGLNWRRRRRREEVISRSYVVANSIEDLRRIRLAPAPVRRRGLLRRRTQQQEGRGLMVLDEMGSILNSRSWSKQDRQDVIEFFAQHRKLGWTVLIIAQDGDMLDKQVRLMVEQSIRLRNLRVVKKFGIPIVPFNLFLAIWTWEATGGSWVTRRETFTLGWWKSLYNTHQIVAGEYALDDPDAIVLPRAPHAPIVAEPHPAAYSSPNFPESASEGDYGRSDEPSVVASPDHGPLTAPERLVRHAFRGPAAALGAALRPAPATSDAPLRPSAAATEESAARGRHEYSEADWEPASSAAPDPADFPPPPADPSGPGA